MASASCPPTCLDPFTSTAIGEMARLRSAEKPRRGSLTS